MPQASLPQRALRKLFRPLYPLYYRFAWGRRFPGGRRLEEWVTRWESLAHRGDAPQPATAWDRQYAEGRWDLMAEPEEAPRYGVLLALARSWGGAGSILDVGCGNGILRQMLPTDDPSRYVGVDLAAEAVERARGAIRPGDELVVADAESWEPGERFDAVVLNECLYYFRRPLETARRYWDARTPGGVLVVSLFATPRSRAIGRGLVERLPLRQGLELRTDRGTWWMAAFRERDPGS